MKIVCSGENGAFSINKARRQKNLYNIYHSLERIKKNETKNMQFYSLRMRENLELKTCHAFLFCFEYEPTPPHKPPTPYILFYFIFFNLHSHEVFNSWMLENGEILFRQHPPQKSLFDNIFKCLNGLSVSLLIMLKNY